MSELQALGAIVAAAREVNPKLDWDGEGRVFCVCWQAQLAMLGWMVRPMSDPDEQRTALRSGPRDTEVKAAWVALPNSGTWRRKILDFIEARGEFGVTDDELGRVFNKPASSCMAPRRGELEQGGWIRDSGLRRPTSVSHGADEGTVWVLSDEGRVRLSAGDNGHRSSQASPSSPP
jgi:hypothetical protein